MSSGGRMSRGLYVRKTGGRENPSSKSLVDLSRIHRFNKGDFRPGRSGLSCTPPIPFTSSRNVSDFHKARAREHRQPVQELACRRLWLHRRVVQYRLPRSSLAHGAA